MQFNFQHLVKNKKQKFTDGQLSLLNNFTKVPRFFSPLEALKKMQIYSLLVVEVKGTKLLSSSVNEHNNKTYLTGYHRDDTT